MKPIIEVRNLSKQYKIGQKQPYLSLRDSVSNFFKFRGRNTEGEDFWALDDVNFDVHVGESIGIIGRNGAGKSTLLKILSRITPPTKGSVILRGRIASLLEVGTGFHPELTGRENVFMNGSILGLKRAEIAEKFDEIVQFSGVEQFIDTPLKHYSSGMQLRLAFAVAAHLEPEILVVDEVLAVGDAEFQKKCLGKMDEVSRSGRTVLFVSHQMNAVQSICQRCILLKEGQISRMGDVGDIVSHYLENNSLINSWESTKNSNNYQSPYFTPTKLAIVDTNLNIIDTALPRNEPINVLIEGYVEHLDSALTVGIALYTQSGELLFWSYQTDTEQKSWPEINKGFNRLQFIIPPFLLNESFYRIELISSLYFRQWINQPNNNAPFITFEINGKISNSPLWIQKRPGLIAPILSSIKLNNSNK
jgi:lipopolysaccharide transport system ATP-binding protein